MRLRFILALAGGIILAAAGLLILASNPTSDMATLGWLFVGLGVLFTATNYAMRKNLR